MVALTNRRIVKAAAGALVATVLFAGTAPAQTVAQFLANPQQVLAQFPTGGPQLISLVRDAVTQNPSALQSITALMSGASADQQAAIGSGLGQAYQIAINNNNQTLANQIAAAVAASGSTDAQTSFAGATGNTQIGAVGGAGGGGAGGGGGTGIGGTAGGTGTGANPPGGGTNGGGTTGTGGTSPTQTSTNTFTGGGGGVGGSTNTGTTGGTTPVSPR